MLSRDLRPRSSSKRVLSNLGEALAFGVGTQIVADGLRWLGKSRDLEPRGGERCRTS